MLTRDEQIVALGDTSMARRRQSVCAAICDCECKEERSAQALEAGAADFQVGLNSPPPDTRAHETGTRSRVTTTRCGHTGHPGVAMNSNLQSDSANSPCDRHLTPAIVRSRPTPLRSSASCDCETRVADWRPSLPLPRRAAPVLVEATADSTGRGRPTAVAASVPRLLQHPTDASGTGGSCGMGRPRTGADEQRVVSAAGSPRGNGPCADWATLVQMERTPSLQRRRPMPIPRVPAIWRRANPIPFQGNRHEAIEMVQVEIPFQGREVANGEPLGLCLPDSPGPTFPPSLDTRITIYTLNNLVGGLPAQLTFDAIEHVIRRVARRLGAEAGIPVRFVYMGLVCADGDGDGHPSCQVSIPYDGEHPWFAVLRNLDAFAERPVLVGRSNLCGLASSGKDFRDDNDLLYGTVELCNMRANWIVSKRTGGDGIDFTHILAHELTHVLGTRDLDDCGADFRASLMSYHGYGSLAHSYQRTDIWALRGLHGQRLARPTIARSTAGEPWHWATSRVHARFPVVSGVSLAGTTNGWVGMAFNIGDFSRNSSTRALICDPVCREATPFPEQEDDLYYQPRITTAGAGDGYRWLVAVLHGDTDDRSQKLIRIAEGTSGKHGVWRHSTVSLTSVWDAEAVVVEPHLAVGYDPVSDGWLIWAQGHSVRDGALAMQDGYIVTIRRKSGQSVSSPAPDMHAEGAASFGCLVRGARRDNCVLAWSDVGEFNNLNWRRFRVANDGAIQWSNAGAMDTGIRTLAAPVVVGVGDPSAGLDFYVLVHDVDGRIRVLGLYDDDSLVDLAEYQPDGGVWFGDFGAAMVGRDLLISVAQ